MGYFSGSGSWGGSVDDVYTGTSSYSKDDDDTRTAGDDYVGDPGGGRDDARPDVSADDVSSGSSSSSSSSSSSGTSVADFERRARDIQSDRDRNRDDDDDDDDNSWTRNVNTSDPDSSAGGTTSAPDFADDASFGGSGDDNAVVTQTKDGEGTLLLADTANAGDFISDQLDGAKTKVNGAFVSVNEDDEDASGTNLYDGLSAKARERFGITSREMGNTFVKALGGMNVNTEGSALYNDDSPADPDPQPEPEPEPNAQPDPGPTTTGGMSAETARVLQAMSERNRQRFEALARAVGGGSTRQGGPAGADGSPGQNGRSATGGGPLDGPLPLVVVAVLLVGGGYYAYKKGYLGEATDAAGDAVDAAKGVIPGV
jgi:hypothetical protein